MQLQGLGSCSGGEHHPWLQRGWDLSFAFGALGCKKSAERLGQK